MVLVLLAILKTKCSGLAKADILESVKLKLTNNKLAKNELVNQAKQKYRKLSCCCLQRRITANLSQQLSGKVGAMGSRFITIKQMLKI